MLKKFSPPFLAFLQTSGLVVYIILVSAFFTLIEPQFKAGTSQFYAPIIMLLVFVMSAVISALLILGRAGVLFWEKKYKQAFTLLGWTIGWGFLYLAMFLAILSVK